MTFRRRGIEFELRGKASSAMVAISNVTHNLMSLSMAYKSLAKHIDFVKQRMERLKRSQKEITKALRPLRSHLGWVTQDLKKGASEVHRFEKAWLEGFEERIKASGQTLDEFMKKQGEKDASMDKNIQKAEQTGSALSQFRGKVNDAGIAIRTMGNRLVGMGRQFSSAGRQMLFFTGALAATAREMVMDFAEYSGSMADVRGAMLLNATAGEDVGQVFKDLRDEVVVVADKYNYAERNVMELAQAMISGGMSGTQAMGLLDKAAMFARANMLGMAQAGELVVRAMGGMETTGMTTIQMMDLLTAVGAKSTESLDSIRASIGFSLVSAQKFGEGFEKEAIASLVHLIKTGESATVAGRRIQGMFEGLTDYSIF